MVRKNRKKEKKKNHAGRRALSASIKEKETWSLGQSRLMEALIRCGAGGGSSEGAFDLHDSAAAALNHVCFVKAHESARWCQVGHGPC